MLGPTACLCVCSHHACTFLIHLAPLPSFALLQGYEDATAWCDENGY